MTEQERTAQEQAARIAAMRARRGQAPINLPSTRTQAVPAEHEQWASPARQYAGVVPTPDPLTPVSDRATSAERPAPTSRTNAPATRGGTSSPAKKKRQHVAAGARIIMTGVTASAVFGLTTVIAAANQPVVSDTATPPAEGVVVAGDPGATTTVVDPNTSLPVQPGDTVPLSIPAIGETTTIATVPGAVPAPAPGAASAPAPAPATPAQGTTKPVTPAPAAPASAPVVTQPAAPAPVVTQPPAPAPVVTQPPAPVTTQAPPPPPPPTTAKASG